MSREQLEKFAQNLRNEIEREREERNFFQLERDKLRIFWEITKNQLGTYFLIHYFNLFRLGIGVKTVFIFIFHYLQKRRQNYKFVLKNVKLK